jgi:hypothetical protein
VLAQAFAGVLPQLLLDSPQAAAVTASACSPTVAGVALDPATDPATTAALVSVARGTVVCPGLSSSPSFTTLQFPASVTSGTAVSFQLGCVRDCLFIATLVGADGRPIVAFRGALTGGAAPTTVVLPRTQLGQSAYTIDVRAISRVNPGALVEAASPPLPRVG